LNQHARRAFGRVADAIAVLRGEAAHKRGFEGASVSGRFPWQQAMPAPTSESLAAAPLLHMRVAHAVANDGHVAAIVNSYTTDIVGDGPSLQHENENIVAAWNAWWSQCDAEGISSLGHFLIRLVRCFVIYGEAFVLLRIDEESGALRLLLLPPAQIDASANEDLGAAGFVVSGIHIARNGRRLRYRVLTTAPDHPFATAADSHWIDASDVAHVLDPMFAGAPRGVSLLAPVLTRSVENDLLMDALLKQQQCAALLSVFVSDPAGGASLGELKNGNLIELRPAAVRLVAPDTTVTTVTPPEANGGIDFGKHMLRSIAAGVALPAWKVSHDLSDVNFSSARMGDYSWRRRAGALQSLLVTQFLQPVFRRFVALEVAAGRLTLDLATLADPVFLWPSFPPIDPLSEQQADVLALQAGLKSRAELISKYGRDPEEVLDEIAADGAAAPRLDAAGARVREVEHDKDGRIARIIERDPVVPLFRGTTANTNGR
jgi:lambda family phage portal protein